MRYCITFLFQIFFIVIVGCSKKEYFITDNVKIDSFYTDGAKALPENWVINDEFDIKITGKDTVFGCYYPNGIGGRTFFYSTNGMKTVSTNHINEFRNIAYHYKNKIIVQYYIYSTGMCETLESNDFGRTFTSKIKFHLYSWFSVYSPIFINEKEGIFFIRSGIQDTYNTDYISVYKITTNTFEKISDINLKVPYSLIPKIPTYIDSDNIFFMAYGISGEQQQPSYIVHSTDGGITWEYSLINTMPQFGHSYSNDYIDNKNVIVINKDKYVFYISQSDFLGHNPQTNDYLNIYYTYDGGINWILKNFNISGLIKSIQFVDSETGYMLVKTTDTGRTYIYKSNDAGESWNIIGPEVYADVISFDANGNGIAVSNKIIQITHDGGLTWNLATYYKNDFDELGL